MGENVKRVQVNPEMCEMGLKKVESNSAYVLGLEPTKSNEVDRHK